MAPKDIPKPLEHKFSTEIQAAIGRFILTWGSLENEINSAIEEIYRLESDMAGCVTANLGTRPKLDIFLSALHMVRECFDNSDEIISEGDSLVNATASAANNHRNFYVHGVIFPIEFKDGPKNFLMKFSARKGGLKVRIQKPDPEIIDKATDEIKALIERWNFIRAAMVNGIELMNFADDRS